MEKMSRYMRAYYHTFTPTGCDAVDAILEAVALAGKSFHSTSQWDEPHIYGEEGPSHWDAIQNAANAAAVISQPDTTRDEALEEAAKRSYDLYKENGYTIAAAIRALKSTPKVERPEGVPEFIYAQFFHIHGRIHLKGVDISGGALTESWPSYRYRFDGVEPEGK